LFQENIAEFGGDPNNVCLMGYDMDASIAGLLALSPVSAAYNGMSKGSLIKLSKTVLNYSYAVIDFFH